MLVGIEDYKICPKAMQRACKWEKMPMEDGKCKMSSRYPTNPCAKNKRKNWLLDNHFFQVGCIRASETDVGQTVGAYQSQKRPFIERRHIVVLDGRSALKVYAPRAHLGRSSAVH